MGNCGIYKITSPSNRIYIGQSTDLKERERFYKYKKCKGQPVVLHSIKKYGWDKHKFEIIAFCEPPELNPLEQYYIKLYDTFESKHGMNLRSGGGQGTLLSKESRIKMGLKHKGNKYCVGIKHTAEARYNMSLAHLGKKLSEKVKQGMSKRRKGVPLSLEHRIKLSKARMGMKFSDSHKKNISLSKTGINSPTNKLSEQNVLDIVFALNNGITVRELMKKYNVRHTIIYSIKNGRRWTHITKLPRKEVSYQLNKK